MRKCRHDPMLNRWIFLCHGHPATAVAKVDPESTYEARPAALHELILAALRWSFRISGAIIKAAEYLKYFDS